jgi:hypothetical protein
MAQPLKQTLGFFEMTVFLADNSINDSFVRAMETKYERWLPLVQGPGISHESVASDDRSGSPDQRAAGKLWQILLWQSLRDGTPASRQGNSVARPLRRKGPHHCVSVRVDWWC